MPRLFAAQPANVAALHAAFAVGSDEPVAIAARPTVAEGIAPTRPVRVKENMAALRETGGGTVAVPEEAILPALTALARRGFFVEQARSAERHAGNNVGSNGTVRWSRYQQLNNEKE